MQKRCRVEELKRKGGEFITLQPSRPRACPARLPAILGSSNGKKHRIALDREARLQAFERVRQKRADQIARAIPKNVSRIDSSSRQVLGTPSEGTHLA